MKKLLITTICALVCICSCQKEENDYKPKDIIGEWKATKIEATFNNGNVLTITDEKEIEDELEELAWITVSENNIRPMKYGYEILIPYEITDNFIIFSGGEKESTYELKSVSSQEMVIKYTNNWTSIISYKRIK